MNTLPANLVRQKASSLDFLYVLCVSAAAATVGLLLWIALDIAYEAWPAVTTKGISLLTSSDWNPNGRTYGIFGYFLGTIVSAFLAMTLALPGGVFIAIFLSEDFLPPPLRHFFRFLTEMLAAIPSVIYGLWGIAAIIPLVESNGGFLARTVGHGLPILAGPAYGNCMLTASLVLALMILPTITEISRNALQSVPSPLREGGYAVGFTRWETIGKILLPIAAPAIVASAVLALGRAMGETMAMAMLIGNSSHLSASLLSPAGTLAGLLANQFAEADGMTIHALMYAAAVLLLLTLGVNLLGDQILRIFQLRARDWR